MTQLRGYQQDLKREIYEHWHAGKRNVLGVLPTGGGKTVVFSSILADHNCAAAAIAHRRELVSQMSMALAREGVRHRIIGPDSLRKACVSLHVHELKRTFYDPNARVAAAGVDTLINHDSRDPWLQQVGLWIQDEAHHVLKANKWGKACAMFPNARGLGVTATPMRADSKGLGSHADGLFEAMVVGPSMRELIRDGFLTDYEIACPPNAVHLTEQDIGDSGEFRPAAVKREVLGAKITGDVVKHYLKLASGRLGVTFAIDVEEASTVAEAYRAAGVPAEVVSAKTPDIVRSQILRRFARREILQLVNVDLFGEGFDLPAIEVVSMARPTASYGLYVQQFGRALRLLDGKAFALIIDHVGNIARHGLPDKPRPWTLNRRERRSSNAPNDAIPMRICVDDECAKPYERVLVACPYCGTVPEPTIRSGPEFVDGDLVLMDAATLAAMRGEVARIDGAPPHLAHLSPLAQAGAAKQHRLRQEAQRELRHSIAVWAGWQMVQGRSQQEGYRRFYHRYGVDVLSAQALGTADALALRDKVQADLTVAGVVDGTVNSVA